MVSPVFNQNTSKAIQITTLLLGSVVLLFGLLGCAGYLFGTSTLLTLIPGMPRIAILTASSFFWLGLSAILILSYHLSPDTPQTKNRLNLLCWISILIPLGIGLFCVGNYLRESHLNFLILILLKRVDDVTPTLMTSSRILIASLAILLFWLWREREAILVYAVGLPALYLIYTSIFALTGHWFHLPFLYKYMVSIPASLGFISMGFALLIGSLPTQGALAPLFSTDSKSKGMALMALLLSFMVLTYGISTIVLTLQHINPDILTDEASVLYFIAELATVLISAVIAVIGLRVVHYRNEALNYAMQEAQAAKALHQSEQKFRRLMDANIAGVIFWQKDGLITDANDAFLNMIGYSREQLDQGSLNLQQITPPGCEAFDRKTRQDLKQQGVSEVEEKQLLTKTGKVVDILIAYALFQDRDDSGIALVIDISARKQAEQSVLDYQARLVESNRELEQFATVASHDLQEPLRKVQVFGEMLAPLVPAEGQDYLARMYKATNRMKALINDLLILSRVSRKGQPFAAVDLNEVLIEVQDDLQISIEESHAEIEIEPLLPVFADRNQMRQLFQNLLSNAVKYHYPGQSAKVRIYNQPETTDRFVQVTVEDHGIGIPPEHQERIFEPFTRLHGISEFSGTGMGLAICKKIVERHQGKLWIESEPEKGSRFHVTLLKVEQPLTSTGILPEAAVSEPEL
jgi:PAS domain S-box-containing protein